MLRFAIIQSQFNRDITQGLLMGALEILEEKNIFFSDDDIYLAPGAFEIPLIARKLAQSGKYAGIICLGAVIKGDTAHFEYISESVAHGLMNVSLEQNIPVSFGILTAYSDEQAQIRSQPGPKNKGREAALACFETAHLLSDI